MKRLIIFLILLSCMTFSAIGEISNATEPYDELLIPTPEPTPEPVEEIVVTIEPLEEIIEEIHQIEIAGKETFLSK